MKKQRFLNSLYSNKNSFYNIGNIINGSSGPSFDFTVKPDITSINLSNPRANGWVAEYDFNESSSFYNASEPNDITNSDFLNGSGQLLWQQGTDGDEILIDGGKYESPFQFPWMASLFPSPNDGEGFTISFIYNLYSTPQNPTLQLISNAAIDNAFSWIEFYTDSVFPFIGSNMNPTFLSIPIVSAVGRQHIIFQQNGQTSSVYQNGSLAGQLVLGPSSNPGPSPFNMRIPDAGTPTNFAFIGARFWNRPLSQNEIDEEFVSPWELLYP